MILHLDPGKHTSVEQHSGKAWLSVYNGCGVTVPLTRQQAIRLRAALLSAILDIEAAEQK